MIKTGSTLAWRSLSVNVPVTARNGAEATTRAILNDVSGFVEPGNMLFVMGPSGSGKSSLLDALADRVKLPVEGVQMLDGIRKSPNTLKNVAKYVQQTNDLFGVLTVQETLDNAAGFYIQEPTRRASAVSNVISLLGLTEQANVKIGNAFFRGLSGGQRTRVSVGIELLASPKLLFLDEPTSGLDSASAFHVMQQLRNLTKNTGMTVIVTVHQPSALLFEMADSLLLLSNGQTCYFGAAKSAGDYFSALGFERAPRMSEVEWILDLINKDFGKEEIVDRCIDSWPASHRALALTADLDRLGVPMHVDALEDDSNTLSYNVGFAQQTIVLFKRGLVNMIRNPVVVWVRFVMYFMLALLVGAAWFRTGKSSSDIADINAALFFINAFFVFMSVSVLPAYIEERSVLIRELANGSYSVFSYIVAHTLFEVPYVGLLAVMGTVVVYFMIGFTWSVERFFVFMANLWASLFCAESIMVLISAVCPILIIAVAAGAFLFGAFMVVMGSFRSIEKIAWVLRWLKFAALHYYSQSTFMVNQYKDTVWTASPGGFPDFPNDVLGESVYRAYGLEERIWVNFLALFCMSIVYRGLAALWMNKRLRGKK